MNAQEWLQRVAPFHLIAKPFQRPRLPVLQDRKGLDYSVAQSCEEFWCAFLHRFENVARELPVVCALFDDSEIFPFTSDCAAPGGIVSMFGMVERLVHETRK